MAIVEVCWFDARLGNNGKWTNMYINTRIIGTITPAPEYDIHDGITTYKAWSITLIESITGFNQIIIDSTSLKTILDSQ